MADESRRPEDIAEQKRLNDQLRGLNAELAREARALDQQAQSRETRADRRVAREERIARERRAPRAGAAAESPADMERAARAARDQAAAEERTARARQQSRNLPVLRGADRLAVGEGAYGGVRLTPAEAIEAYARRILATGGGGGIAPPPPRPPAAAAAGDPGRGGIPLRELIGATQRSGAETDAFAEAQARAQAHVDAARASVDQESLALRRSAVSYDAANQGLRRHGALTTEFISAAARGNATLAEMRFQVGSTIGKFAGWTAAGAAVFGVLGAVNALGRGAIDSSAGVNQLQRVIKEVDSDRAQQGFRQQSRRFNLPVADVAEAQYSLGKYFGDQNKALEATPALLAAVKVGELSVADASRFLIATTNAYSLQASELLPLLDQYDSLQNNMGVSIRDTAAGVAKAAGAFRAAGGDLGQLIAIVGAGTRVSGFTGEQFGTALQRSAQLVRRPKNQEILRSFGIDPTASISQIYTEAFKVARRLSGQQRAQLAEGLSTPQLAPRLTALLNRPDAYRRALGLVAPDVAAGTSMRELGVQLGSVQERIHRIGTDLQDLGSTLSSAGVFNVPGAFIAGLDGVLHTSTGILSIWSEVPAPMRHSVATALELLAVMRLLQRFNVGDALAHRAPEVARLMQQSPERRARSYIGQGLAAEQTFFRDELERTRRQAAVARTTVLTGGRTLRAMPVSTAAEIDAVNHQEAAVVAARARAVELQNADTALVAELDASVKRSNAFKAEVITGRKISALEFARRNELYMVEDLARPTTTPVRSGAEIYAARQQQFNAAIRDRVPAAAGRLSGVALVGSSAAARASTAVTIASRNIRGLAGGMFALGSRLFAGLGPLGLLAVASFAIPEAAQAYSDAVKGAAKDLADAEEAGRQALTRAELGPEIKRLRDVERRGPTIGERLRGLTRNVTDPFSPSNWFSIAGDQEAQARQDAAKRSRETLDTLRRVQKGARSVGASVPGQTIAEISRQRDDDLTAFKRGTLTEDEFHARLQKRLEEYRISSEHEAHPKRTRSAINRTRRMLAEQGSGRAGLYAGLDEAKILTRMQSYLAVGEGEDFAANLRRAEEGYRVLRRKIGRDRSPEALQKLAQAREAVNSAIRDHAQKLDAIFDSRTDLLQSETTDPLAQARILRDRLLAKIDRTRRLYDRGVVSLDVLNRAVAEENRALQQVAAAQLADFQANQQLAGARYGASHVGDQGGALRNALAQARRQVAYVRGLAHRPHGALRDALKALYEAQTAWGEYAFQAARELADAQLQYSLAGVDDPVRRAELQLRGDVAAQRFQRTAAERLQQRAKIRQDRADVRRARYQDSFDTIEYEASIGKIERDAEIARLRALEKTIRGNRDLKRQIAQRIYDLKKQAEDQADIELNVGDIRLPTLYDVRRLIGQGTNNQPTVHQSFAFSISGAGDPHATAAAVVGRFEKTSRTGLRAAQRAAGVR